MLKNTIIILCLIISISFVIFIPLFDGITFDNINFKNITIKGLYLKYDKSLIVSVKKIKIYDQNRTNSQNISFDTNITTVSNILDLKINIKNFLLDDPFLKVNSIAYINLGRCLLNDQFFVTMKNLTLQFDQNLSSVYSQQVDIKYKDNIFFFTPIKPSYDGITLVNSQVSLNTTHKDESLLLQLHLKQQITKPLLNLLKYYGVSLPIKQFYGLNDISTTIKIPFKDEQNITISSNINIKNSKISVEGNDIYIKYLKGILKDDKIVVDGIVNNFNIENSYYHYDTKIDGVIYLNSMIARGKFNINKFIYQDLNIKDTKGTYEINLNDNFKVNLSIDNNNTILYKKSKQNINNCVISYSDAHINSKLLYKDNNITFNISDSFNLSSFRSIGVASIDGIVGDVKFVTKKLHYMYDLNNSKVVLQKNRLKVEYNDKNISIDTALNLDLGKKEVDGIVDCSFKNSLVNIVLKDTKFKLLYKKNLILTIPQYNLKYTKEDKSNIIQIDHISKIAKFIPTLSVKENKNNKLVIAIFENRIGVYGKDIDLTIFDNMIDSNSNTKPKYFVNIYLENGKIVYKKTLISYKSILGVAGKELNLNIVSNDFKVNLQKDNDDILIKAKDINKEFINTLFDKVIIQDGYIDLNMRIHDNNLYTGEVYFNNTDLKDLKLLNQIITFVNTTPGLVNPLLLLPTLFTVTQNDFKFDSYLVKDGYIKFIYNVILNRVNMYDIYTNSAVSNITGSLLIDKFNNTLNGSLDITFLKTYSKILKNIPIVGALTLGKDGNIHTGVSINGTIDNPTFDTHAIETFFKGLGKTLNQK